MADRTPTPTPVTTPTPPLADERAGIARGTPRRSAVCIDSATLFAGATEIHIEHRGALYRLQQTSLGKLILTK